MVREGWVKADADYGRFKSQIERVPADRFPADRKFNPLTMHPFMLHRALGQAKKLFKRRTGRAMELLLLCNSKNWFPAVWMKPLVLQQTFVQLPVAPGLHPPRRAAFVPLAA